MSRVVAGNPTDIQPNVINSTFCLIAAHQALIESGKQKKKNTLGGTLLVTWVFRKKNRTNVFPCQDGCYDMQSLHSSLPTETRWEDEKADAPPATGYRLNKRPTVDKSDFAQHACMSLMQPDLMNAGHFYTTRWVTTAV